MIRFIRLLLFPVSILYGAIIVFRNLMYDTGLLKQYFPSIPVISIGNLAVGGTGKTPVTEYIARLLEGKRIAVLSRGYGRESIGFLEVLLSTSAADAGDEPLQLKTRLPALTVAVCENRVMGIKALEAGHDVILLDDAFQHRAVKPGLSILLFDHETVGKTQFMLPSGNLREPLWGRRRADLLLITKAHRSIPVSEQGLKSSLLKPYTGQSVFFSYLEYGKLIDFHGGGEMEIGELGSQQPVVLLTGIANPAPLLAELRKHFSRIDHRRFRDHHTYSRKNIAKLATGKIIITTEKDAQRLRSPELREAVADLQIWYLPVAAKILERCEAQFNHIILNYVDPKNT